MTEHLTPAQRESYIDASKKQALEVLHIPKVQHRLGGYADTLFALTNSITPVAVKDGLVSTDAIHPKALPATVVRSGEEITRLTTADPFDSFQLEAMQGRYNETGIDTIARHLKQARKIAPIRPFGAELAYMHTVSMNNGFGELVRGRPMILFNYDASSPYVSAPVLLHEAIHAEQARKLPIWNKNEIDFDSQDLSWELEGYAVAAMTILGIRDAGLQDELLSSIPHDSVERALEVYEITKRANKLEINPYAGTKKVAEELINNGHGITSFLQEKIANK